MKYILKFDGFALNEDTAKIFYPFKTIKHFIEWFNEEYKGYAEAQGWSIFDSDTNAPNKKYVSNGNYWQIQKLDAPGAGEALIGNLSSDDDADIMAKKLGLMIDEYGVIYGWEGTSFL